VTEPGLVSLSDLRVGDCVKEVTEGKVVTSMRVVPCADLHRGEVYATFDLAGGAWRADVPKEAEQGCSERLEPYSKKAFDDPTIDFFYFAPEERSWARGDHGVICLVVTSSDTTGSLKGQ
jgi:hypothetical protein